MRSVLILIFLMLVLLPVSAVRAQGGGEDLIIAKNTMLYCMTPVFFMDSAARVAEERQLSPLPPEEAVEFLKDSAGQVFALPDMGAQAALVAYDDGACQVMLKETDYADFWVQMDEVFEIENAPWTLSVTEEGQGKLSRTYEGEFNGPVLAIVTAHKRPREDGMQAVVTISRVETEEGAAAANSAAAPDITFTLPKTGQ